MDGEQATNGNGTETAVTLTGRNAEALQELLDLPHPLIRLQEVQMTFRTKEEEIKDAEGKVIEKKKTKRPPFKLTLPVLTFEGLTHALKHEKTQNFVLNLLGDAVYDAAKQQVDDELNPVNDQEHLDLSKLTIEYLASQPASERRGTGIPKEVWDAFSKDWMAVMQAAAGKTAEQAANSAKILLTRLQTVKTNKKVLKVLKDQVGVWFQNTTNGEEFSEVCEFLINKADEFIAADDSKLLDNI